MYPRTPGYKRSGTSKAAARTMKPRAPTLHWRILDSLRNEGDGTADEIASRIGATVLAVRPRMTELSVQRGISDTGKRRANSSGKMAIVWELG